MKKQKLAWLNITPFIVPVVFVLGLVSGYYINPSILPTSPAPSAIGATENSIQVCFTPSMQCLPLIEKALREAKKSIYVQAYSLTSKPVANALIVAHQRGVHVEIIADRGQINARYSQVFPLKEAGISVWIDGVQGLQHNKIIIIDESKLICWSYNFSNAAENRNAENLLVISNPKLAQQYLQNWQNRKAQSTPLEGQNNLLIQHKD